MYLEVSNLCGPLHATRHSLRCENIENPSENPHLPCQQPYARLVGHEGYLNGLLLPPSEFNSFSDSTFYFQTFRA